MWGMIISSNPLSMFATALLALQSPQDLSNRFRKLYTDLEHPGEVYRHATPTLRFSFVPPPSTTKKKNATTASSSASNDNTKKPIAVYLPGLDGYGISAQQHQFDDLAQAFEFWRLTILPNDRSSFGTVVNVICDFCQELVAENDDGQQVTLIGESCGGLLAAAVAIKLQNKKKRNDVLEGLVMVNPATSFDQTVWDTLAPLLTSLQYLDNNNNELHNNAENKQQLTPYSVLGSLILASIIPDEEQTQRIVDTIRNLPDLQNTTPLNLGSLRNLTTAMRDVFVETEQRLPPALLQHRVEQWLTVGNQVVNAERLQEITVPTLIVAGGNDRLVPSQTEAERLSALLPNAETLIVPDRGHFVLDDTVNLTEAIQYSPILTTLSSNNNNDSTKTYDPVMDWKLPTDALRTFIQESVQPFRDTFSPVYFSTDERTGKRWKGMSKIPSHHNDDKPILFVANHQFLALDLRLLMADLYEERGIFPRGLAHPVTFMGSNRNDLNFGELGGRRPGVVRTSKRNEPNELNGGFEKFGAVMVTPRNYYRLMQTGQDALLFPGGGAEAMSGNKSYPLFWPEKVDFVRTAARFNATIVPLSAVGMVDSVNVLAEPQDVVDLPFIGDRLKKLAANTTSARYDQKPEDEIIGIPVALPAVPARNYFLFGKPIDTSAIDPRDKEACRQIYTQAQDEVRRGIDDILRAREHDPFKNTPARLAYERVFKKQAPTFPVSELN